MASIFKMGLKLLLITSIAAMALGLTHMITESPIAMQNERANTEARMAVLPGAEEFVPLEITETPGVLEVYQGYTDNKAIGYTFKVVSKGYGGDLEVIVGITNDGAIGAVEVVKHHETPGLGAKANELRFRKQYQEKLVKHKLKYDEIEAITGATITSNGVTNAVNIAIDYLQTVIIVGGEE